MKTITHLTTLVRDLNDESILHDGSPLTIRSVLTACIVRGQNQDPVRMIELAHRLFHHEGDTFDVDDADLKVLQETIRTDRLYTDIVKAPLLEMLKAAETPLELKEEATDEQS